MTHCSLEQSKESLRRSFDKHVSPGVHLSRGEPTPLAAGAAPPSSEGAALAATAPEAAAVEAAPPLSSEAPCWTRRRAGERGDTVGVS